jgi:bisphosphoglycerate-dependent phosphoglycerate mutase
MSAKMELRWLKEDNFQGVSQRFVKFCKKDIFQQAKEDENFDLAVYESSIRLILKKLEQAEEQKQQGVM